MSGLAAAAVGLVDYVAIRSATRAKRVALAHGIGNVVVLALFVVTWVLRRDVEDNVPTAAALVVALVAAGITVVAAWLGGELVDRLGVGVDDDAHLDASPRATTGVFLRRG